MRAPNSRRGILYRSFVSISHFWHSGMNPPRNLSHRLAHHRNPTERLDESVVEIACVLALCSPVSCGGGPAPIRTNPASVWSRCRAFTTNTMAVRASAYHRAPEAAPSSKAPSPVCKLNKYVRGSGVSRSLDAKHLEEYTAVFHPSSDGASSSQIRDRVQGKPGCLPLKSACTALVHTSSTGLFTSTSSPPFPTLAWPSPGPLGTRYSCNPGSLQHQPLPARYHTCHPPFIPVLNSFSASIFLPVAAQHRGSRPPRGLTTSSMPELPQETYTSLLQELSTIPAREPPSSAPTAPMTTSFPVSPLGEGSKTHAFLGRIIVAALHDILSSSS